MNVKQWVFYIRNREGFSKELPQLLRHCLEVSIRKIKTGQTKGVVKLGEDKEKTVLAILAKLVKGKKIDGLDLCKPPKEIPAPPDDDVDTSVPYWLCEKCISVRIDNSNLSELTEVTSIINDYVDGRYPWKEFPGYSGKNTMTILIQVTKEAAKNLLALFSKIVGPNNVVLGANKWFRGEDKK